MRHLSSLVGVSLLLAVPLPLLAADNIPASPQAVSGSETATQVNLDSGKEGVEAKTVACVPPPGLASCPVCKTITYDLPKLGSKDKGVISCYVKEGSDTCTPPGSVSTRCESVDYKEAWDHRFDNNATVVTWGTLDTPPAVNALKEYKDLNAVRGALPGFALYGFDDTSAGDTFPTAQVTRSLQQTGDLLSAEAELSYLPFIGGGSLFSLAPQASQNPEDYGLTSLGAGLYQTKDGAVVSLPSNGNGTFAPVQTIELTQSQLDPGSLTSYTPGFQEAIKWGICGVLGDEQGCGTAATLTAGLCLTPLGVACLIEDDVNAIKRGDYVTAALITGGTVGGGVVLGKMVGFADAMIAENIDEFVGLPFRSLGAAAVSPKGEREVAQALDSIKKRGLEGFAAFAGENPTVAAKLVDDPTVNTSLLKALDEAGPIGYSNYETILRAIGYSEEEVAQQMALLPKGVIEAGAMGDELLRITDPTTYSRILRPWEEPVKTGVRNDHDRNILLTDIGESLHSLNSRLSIQNPPKVQEFYSQLARDADIATANIVNIKGRYYSVQPTEESILQIKPTTPEQVDADISLIAYLTDDSDFGWGQNTRPLNFYRNSAGCTYFFDFGCANFFRGEEPGDQLDIWEAYKPEMQQYVFDKLDKAYSFWASPDGYARLKTSYEKAGQPLAVNFRAYGPRSLDTSFDDFYAKLLIRTDYGRAYLDLLLSKSAP